MSFKLGTNKKYTDTFWFSLDLDDHSSPDWEVAVDIFKDRIQGRFLNHVSVLQENAENKIKYSCGFTVLAIDCLLIETLLQFYKGIKETNQQFRNQNSRAFNDFFVNSKFFKKHFDSHDKARIFYTHVRCGILHQAQTKGKTTINVKSRKMIEWVNASKRNEGFKINRKIFHDALVKEYNSYCSKLLDPNNKILRKKFRTKMNFIATS